MYKPALSDKCDIRDIYKNYQYRKNFAREHPYFFEPIGTMIFCGSQGTGKTLSAVNYVMNVLRRYPYAILCTNVSIRDYSFNAYIHTDGNSVCIKDKSTDETIKSEDIINGRFKKVCIEYDGLDSLKNIENGEYGVIYLIDELHLELNSLESKNIDIDVMTEISQQRKQRKHIVGTSQVYMRLAKPLREQIFNVVLCRKFFKSVQYNKLIDGEESKEENGKLNAKIVSRHIFFHRLDMYERYDTYAKMKRYRKEWQGHKREAVTDSKTVIVYKDKK